MVGVQVYHVAPYVARSVQKEGVRREGIMTEPPEHMGARVDARRPWIWKMGIIRMVRSLGVKL